MLRTMTKADFVDFWPTFSAVIQAQETYALDPKMSLQAAYHLWCELPKATYVFVEQGEILGSYYIKANALGPGDHICNCGYMVAKAARGQGIARRMCLHSQEVALALGFSAMQFNSVVASNQAAVHLWQDLGFNILGKIPKGYRHARLGYVDTLVMYKWLADQKT